MKTISETLQNNLYGLYYGNRIILPFSGTILKMVLDNDIYMDFSPDSKTVFIKESEQFMEIYFKAEDNLDEVVSKFENIKLIIVEKGADIFNFDNHKKIALQLEEGHKVKVIEIDEDILFIE